MTSLKKFLPDGFGALGIIVLAVALEVAVCFPSIVIKLGLDNPNTQSFTHQLISQQLSILSSSKIASDLVIIAFWGSLGFIVYLVSWIIINFIIQLRNQAMIQATYTNRGSVLATWQKSFEHFLSGLILLAFLVAFLFSLELWSVLGNQGVLALPDKTAILDVIAAVGGLSLSMFVINIVWRFTSWVAGGRVDR